MNIQVANGMNKNTRGESPGMVVRSQGPESDYTQECMWKNNDGGLAGKKAGPEMAERKTWNNK